MEAALLALVLRFWLWGSDRFAKENFMFHSFNFKLRTRDQVQVLNSTHVHKLHFFDLWFVL